MKQSLSVDEIKHLAALSGLHLTEEEIKKNQEQLSETLQYMENLKELNTDHTIPTSNVSNLQNVFFDDGGVDNRGLTQKQALSNGKKQKGGQFYVKRIL